MLKIMFIKVYYFSNFTKQLDGNYCVTLCMHCIPIVVIPKILKYVQ